MSASEAANATGVTSFSYPVSERRAVIDSYHGKEVLDHYRWLEDPDSAETGAWAQKQQSFTEAFLSTCPGVSDLQEKLKHAWNYERFSCPFHVAGKFFYLRNDGLQNQSVMYVQHSLTGAPEVLLDPNTLESDGTAALGPYAVAESGKYLAYGVSRSGSDWNTIFIRNTSSKTDLPDKLEWVKFSSVSWTHDDAGFFYSKYPKPMEFKDKNDENFKRGTETSTVKNQALFYHRLGTPQDSDVCIYKNESQPNWLISGSVSDDGKYLLISINDSCDPVNRLFYVTLQSDLSVPSVGDLKVIEYIDNFHAEYNYVANEGSVFYFKTNLRAPKYRILQIDLNVPHDFDEKKDDGKWKEIIPQSPDGAVLNSATATKGSTFILCYMHHVKEVLRLFSYSGAALPSDLVSLSDMGSITGVSAPVSDSFIFFAFSSFLSPGIIYHVDLSAKSRSVFKEIKVSGIDPLQFQTEQIFYASKDGTQIPMFIVSKKGMQRNSSNPTLLYGYGGFNISLTPSFSPARLVFLNDFDAVFALANLRGGGEYGEEWHQQGTKLKKQNVFDDFIAAAETLIKLQITRPDRLAINGGSNGGLLVGAVTNQRPELFGAAVAAVGVLDMLRFHKFTIGYAWCSDYGSSDNPDEFKALFAYSPVHNVRSDRAYPAVLLTTSDHDDRVVPLHSFKYIAELQHHLGSQPFQKQPLLIRIEIKAGHGAATPLSKRIQEAAEVYAFIAKALGVKPNTEAKAQASK